MNQTDLTNNSTNLSVSQAEQNVRESLHRFEVAMDQLANKVESVVFPFHQARRFAWNTKYTLEHYRSFVKSALVRSLSPYASKAKYYTNKAVTEVRANPKPYIWTAVGVTVGVCALLYLQKKKSRY